ncbi:DUF1330 domain-containing protein [Denitratisoma oestradiolicum]|uniref:Uncharacterized protein n=1 Tax=Denitratisoma oestradiolicum TaxID=311182 RepID=A0A6S6XX98_9PROT|nr:DUF1330 domain-containing protein [Denitratisoma oestradiolicum]TWO79151.1 hypothetical protein CBW56_16215 [Denitratisoma oestradiolicum]CAB1369594.1 conserved protein of unknown function [Denitratisoma oestradiolicum]
MAAYIVVRARVTDPGRFSAYARLAAALVHQFGGEYLVLGSSLDVLEGQADSRKVVISRWPDKDAARRFWDSSEYQAAKLLRENTGEFEVALVDGLSAVPSVGL